jgi:hypothetical protein
MIIRVETQTRQDAANAKEVITGLARQWGHDAVEHEPRAFADDATPSGDKAIDPIAATALVLSIPSVALAVVDLTDRIRNRRRAEELIDSARQLAGRQVNVYLVVGNTEIRIDTMSPDDLLDGRADEEPDG